MNPEKYIDLMGHTELGQRLATPAGRRTALYDMLANHPDPVWREMGEQLKTGRMRPSDMFAVPAYREHLMAGLEQAKERHGELFGAVAAAATEPAPTPRGPSPRDEDEPDEVAINWVRR
jgi:hypothetical protein